MNQNNIVKRFLKNESGATAIEYGLIASLIAVVIIGAVMSLGYRTDEAFGEVSGAMGSTRYRLDEGLEL